MARRALPAGSREALRLDLRRAQILLDPLARPTRRPRSTARSSRSTADRSEARDGLEAALRDAGDLAGLAEQLASRAAYEADPQARAALELERAALLEQLPDGQAGARRGARTGARLRSRSLRCATPPRERLASLLERAGDMPALRALLEASLGDADASDAGRLHERLGRLCRERLADANAALHHFEAAARLAPGRAEPWRALAELHAEAGRNSELLQALEAELATGPEPEREIGLRSRAAALLAQRAGGCRARASPLGARARARSAATRRPPTI